MNRVSIGSDNGLSPVRRQAVIWTNAGTLLIRPLGTNCSENLIGIQTFSLKQMHFKTSSAKWCVFCIGLNVIRAPRIIMTSWQPWLHNLDFSHFAYIDFEQLRGCRIAQWCLSALKFWKHSSACMYAKQDEAPSPHGLSNQCFYHCALMTSYAVIELCEHRCFGNVTWWRHQMETFSALLAICAQKGQWRGALIFFFDLRVKKQLSKQWWGWWFETLSRPLWRHRNDNEEAVMAA